MTNDDALEGVTTTCCTHCGILSKVHGMLSSPWNRPPVPLQVVNRFNSLLPTPKMLNC